MTNIVSQNSDFDFFAMSAPEQKMVLDDAMGIGMLSAFKDCLKEARLAHIQIKDMLHSVRDSMVKTFNADKVDMLRKDLAQRSQRQTILPKWMPVSLEPKQYYKDIIKSFNPKLNDIVRDLAQYDQRVVPVSIASNNVQAIIEEYQTFGEAVGTKQVAERFDVKRYEELSKRFAKVKQPVFDNGPFNPKCTCCKERKASVVDLDDFMMWAKLQNYRKLSLSNALHRYVSEQVDLDQYKDAVSILDNYENIQNQFKIESLKHQLAAISDKELDIDFLEFIDEIEEREKNISVLSSNIEAYSADLYTEKILPAFTKRINDIIGCLTDHLQISYDVNSKGQFDWSLDLNETKTTIAKASGFQRFAMSLACRISLAQVGELTCMQLFIDEGFSACDEIHLREVPEFLHKLIGPFLSVCIVTHIQELKDVIPSIITIGTCKDSDKIHPQIIF